MIFDRSKTTVAHRGTSIASKVGALMLAVLLCLGSSPHSARAETEGTALSTQVTSTATDTTSAAAEASQATAPNPTIESPKGATALAEQVTATLLIGVQDASGTKMLVNKAYTVEEGSSVEQMLDQAVADGDIDAYAHGEAYSGYTGYYVNSITVKGATYAQPADFSSYWSSRIDGGDDFTGINDTKITHDGFSYQLTLTPASADPGATVVPDPDASHEDKDSSWSGSPQSPAGNTSAATTTPKTPDTAELFWKNNLLVEGQTYACISDPLIIDGKIYIAYGPWGSLAKLSVFNATTGALEMTTPLAAAIESSTCRPVYADGIIVVPLVKGQLQGLSAENLKTMWMSPMISDSSQAVSGLTVVDGRVYTGTADTLSSDYSPIATSGHFMCVDLNNGQVLWSKANATSGYYWSGATLIGSALVFGDDAGTLVAVDPATGATLSTLSLGSASIRSTVITDGGNTVGYVASA
ncbi:MAG: PQQ-binding-like beta-propeller repeat protein, partial [Raoultibacter sp.]